MPIFEYECSDCHSRYEILFKSSEQKDLVVCPSCESRNHMKKFSMFAASMGSSAPSYGGCADGSCAIPSSPCASGMCGLN